MDIKDPPTIVKRTKNRDTSKFDEYVDIPDVEIDVVMASNTSATFPLGITKK